MSIPVTTRTELPVSSIGTETYVQNVIAKNTLWTTYIAHSYLFLKEYSGYYSNFNNQFLVKKYLLTQALKSDKTFDTDKFWLWIIDNNNYLSLYEIEPFTASSPVVTWSKLNILSGAANISVHVRENDYIRLMSLSTIGNLTSSVYDNIKNSDPPVVDDLTWTVSRLTEFSNFVYPAMNELSIAYLDVASPPNVYLDSYLVLPPTNLASYQIGTTNEVYVSWDTVTAADLYILEIADNPSFTSATSISQVGNTYSYFLSLTGTYYYRVRAVISALYLQSLWSSTSSTTVSLTAYFVGAPLSGTPPMTVFFTDLSTPVGTLTGWDWNFGDGSAHSYLQYPSHTYTLSGTFTVSLTTYSGLNSDTYTATDYVAVASSTIIDFIATPVSGDANLTVQFTDISIGTGFTHWDWNFGDGSAHSNVQNPTHTYTTAGIHNVTLTLNYTNSKTRPITVFLKADIGATPPYSYPPATIQFNDLTLGQPTSWDWYFGDGSAHSNVQNPIHIYASSGAFTVVLVATRGSFSDTATYVMNVLVDVRFRCSPIYGYDPLVVYFRDKTSSIPAPNSWLWAFGDGTTSIEQFPSHRYQEGVYSVSLTVSNGTRTDTLTKLNHIHVVKFKDIIISSIQTSADTYGTPEVVSEWGTNGTQWQRKLNKYQEIETVVEGLANALMNRTIEMGLPFNSLIKNICSFISPDNIYFDDIFGIMNDDLISVDDETDFNNTGNKVIGVPINEFKYGITGEQQVNSEDPADFEISIGPNKDNLSIEKTLWKIQAAISDRVPVNATESLIGSVRKGKSVSAIPCPVTYDEIKINQLIYKLKTANLI